MATFDFRILLETVQGKKSSYMSQSFVDTSVDLVLSASQVFNRITGSVSCSYQNSPEFSQSAVLSSNDINTNFTFKDNLLLSASLSGSLNTGSIDFNASTDEYDRLLRYKFFGEKVCNVLGLANAQWIYVDQVRFPADDESNIFQGNIDVGSAFISDTLTFANNANVNSDVPFLIDTGSDRYIKFIDTRGTGNASLIFGYDKDKDLYEINASENTTFNINNVNSLTAGTITASIYHQELTVGETQLNTLLAGVTTVSGSVTDEPLLRVQGNISASGIITASGFKVRGDMVVDGSVTAEEFITKQITVQNGSNIFGNSADDIHQFTGSIRVTGSGVHYFQTGSVGIGTTNPITPLHIESNVNALADTDEPENYHLLLRNPANDTGEGTGLAFLTSTQTVDVGSSLIFKRTDGQSKGELQFYVKTNTDSDGAMTQAMVIDDSANIGIKTTSPTKALQVTGEISSSGNITTEGQVEAEHLSSTDDLAVAGKGSIQETLAVGTTTHAPSTVLTVEGNISSSGTIKANTLDADTVTDAFAAIVVTEIDDGEISITKLTEDSVTYTAGDGMTGGGEVQLGSSTTLNVIGGGGISMSADNVAVNPTQTTISSLKNPTLQIGRDDDNFINFGTDNKITFKVEGNNELQLSASTLFPVTNNGLTLGLGAKAWSDLFLADGAVISFNNSELSIQQNNLQLEFSGMQGTEFVGHITASGNISSSATSTASFGLYKGDGSGLTGVTGEWDGTLNGDAQITGSLVLSGSGGHITASGNISSSGTLISNEINTIGHITASGNISSSGTVFADNITFDGPRAADANTIKFGGLSQLSSSKVAGLQWDFPNDDFFIYAHQSSSDKTRMVFESRDNLTDKFVFWFNSPGAQANSASNAFPLSMTGTEFVVNNIYERATTYHRDGDGVGNLPANNVDFYLLKSGSGAVSKVNSLIFGDVSDSQVTINGDITASGNISSSGNIKANKLQAYAGGIISNGNTILGNATTDTHTITGHITASNNISSSGTIVSNVMTPTTITNVNTTHITASGNISASATSTGSFGNIQIPDDGQINLGDGNDLQIFHRAGVYSRIKESGTGPLQFSSNRFKFMASDNTSFMIDAISGGGIELYHNNSKTLEVTSSGINVTGNITASGNISGSGEIRINQIYVDDGAEATPSIAFGTAGQEDTGLYRRSNNVIGFSAGGDGQMTLNESGVSIGEGYVGSDNKPSTANSLIVEGSVGINETTPSEKLHVIGNIRIETGTDETNYLDFREVDDPRARIEIDTSTNKNFTLQTTNVGGTLTDRLNIKTEQNDTQVVIGGLTPAPNMELTVVGDISASGTVFAGRFESSGSATGIDIVDSVDITGDITASGTGIFNNVGIGIENPSHQLHIKPSSGISQIKIESDVSHAELLIDADTGFDPNVEFQEAGVTKWVVGVDTSNGELFQIGTSSIVPNDNKFVIDTGGRVGIGIKSPSEKLDVDGNIKARDKIVSETFSDGIEGSGFRIETGSNGSLITVDNLTVRKQLNAFEFLIHQVRATNGSLFVSNTGKIVSASLSGVANHYSMSFETGSGLGHSFVVGDLIRAQRSNPSTNGSGSIIFQSDLQVVSVNNTGSLVGALSASAGEQHPTSQSAPQPGYEYVRIGSLTEEDRQGIIYMTADDGNAPFIEVASGITSHSHFNTSEKSTVRMGRLDGITTANSAFGTLSGFGLYASGSAFLEGGINATIGEIGGFIIGSNIISSSTGGLILKSDGQITGSDVLFDGGTVGGFVIGSDIISSSAGTLILKDNGQITASAVSMSGTITADDGEIGGFGISETTIVAGNLTLDSTNEEIKLGGSADATSTTGIFLKSDGTFNLATDADNFIRKNNNDLQIKSKNTFLSGSNVKIISPNVFLGTTTGSFISSSVTDGTGSIEISSSNFHLLNGNITASNVDLSGKITATSGEFSGSISSSAGKIGGFSIGDNKLSSTNLVLSSSTTETDLIISTSKFQVDGAGGLTASAANISGSLFSSDANISGILSASEGNIGGFTIGTTFISSSNLIISSSTGNAEIISASNFNVKANGQVTASNVSMSGTIVTDDIDATGGTIGGFTLGANKLSSDNLVLSSSTTAADEIISASNFNVKASGQVTASNVLLSTADVSGKITTSDITADGGTIGGFTLGVNSLEAFSASSNVSLFKISSSTVPTELLLSSSKFQVTNEGQLTASNALITGEINATSGNFSGSISSSAGIIGGFEISTILSSSNGNIILDPIGNEIAVGTGTDENVIKIDSNDGLFAGANSAGVRSDSTPFQVSPTGRMTASTALIKGASNVLCDTSSTGSFGRLDGSAQHTTLGSGSIQLNTFTRDTTMYDAIKTIDSVLNKLAPNKPPSLSDSFMSLDFNTSITTFTGRGTNGAQTESITTKSNPTFTVYSGSTENVFFFDGDNGELTASRAVNDGSFSNIGVADITTGDDKNTYQTNLVITADDDFHLGTAGSEGFWRALKAQIVEESRTAGTDRYFVKLKHSITGEVSKSYYVDDLGGNPSTVTNTDMSYTPSINGFHYQSGIPYLGQNDTITASYDVQISSDANFLNSSGIIGSAEIDNVTNELTKTVTTAWTAGSSFNVSSSLTIQNSKFKNTSDAIEFKEFNSQNTSGTHDDTQDVTKNFNIDSFQEDETLPDGSGLPHRSGSGTGEFPSFAENDKVADVTTFGSSFNTTASLKTTNHFELQFSRQRFHWPASTDYSNYIPSGPDYTSMNSDTSHNNLRWVTFKIGTIPLSSNFTIRLESCNGFDNADIQTSDGFEMYAIVMDGSTRVTNWINCNEAYPGAGNPGELSSPDGDIGGVSGFTNGGVGANKDFLRTITFGGVPREGTIYVRAGWDVNGGTNPLTTNGSTNTNGTRMFKYIELV